MTSPTPTFRTLDSHRVLAFGLAAVMTFGVLAGLGQVADHQHSDALYAQSAGASPRGQAVMTLAPEPLG